MSEWIKVIWSGDCDEFDNCPVCEIDFADCDCPGPTQDDEFEYQMIDGELYARRIAEAD